MKQVIAEIPEHKHDPRREFETLDSMLTRLEKLRDSFQQLEARREIGMNTPHAAPYGDAANHAASPSVAYAQAGPQHGVEIGAPIPSPINPSKEHTEISAANETLFKAVQRHTLALEKLDAISPTAPVFLEATAEAREATHALIEARQAFIITARTI